MPDKNDKIKLKIRNDVYKVPDKIYKIKLSRFENKRYCFPYICGLKDAAKSSLKESGNWKMTLGDDI